VWRFVVEHGHENVAGDVNDNFNKDATVCWQTVASEHPEFL